MRATYLTLTEASALKARVETVITHGASCLGGGVDVALDAGNGPGRTVVLPWDASAAPKAGASSWPFTST